jgi:hypothetical protein
VKSYWQFLGAFWPDDDTEADLPVTPAGEVPVLQSDFTVKWEAAAGGSTDDILTDDATGEILVDEDTGNVLTDG